MRHHRLHRRGPMIVFSCVFCNGFWLCSSSKYTVSYVDRFITPIQYVCCLVVPTCCMTLHGSCCAKSVCTADHLISSHTHDINKPFVSEACCPRLQIFSELGADGEQSVVGAAAQSHAHGAATALCTTVSSHCPTEIEDKMSRIK